MLAADTAPRTLQSRVSATPDFAPRARRDRRLVVRLALFMALVMSLVALPFLLLGESFVTPLLAAREHQAPLLVLIAIALLAADAVAPVPSVLVLVFLAAKTGWIAGVIGGTVGLCAGVVLAWWFGRVAVGRLAPKFFPEAELARLRDGLQRRLPLTLACWRSLPVMAETSVIVAAAAGVPLGRVFRGTLLPNFLIALIYSVAADDSVWFAALAFVATVAGSLIFWRRVAGIPIREQLPPTP